MVASSDADVHGLVGFDGIRCEARILIAVNRHGTLLEIGIQCLQVQFRLNVNICRASVLDGKCKVVEEDAAANESLEGLRMQAKFALRLVHVKSVASL